MSIILFETPYVTVTKAGLSLHTSVKADGRGSALISIGNGRDLITSYSGPAELQQAITTNEAQPLALASADFDEDGVPDLITGFAAAGGGLITLHRGNIDSIYPNSPEARKRKAGGELTDSPFLSPATMFAVPEAADFIGAGDFDNDGHWDVATAKRGGDALYLLSGDGGGLLRTGRRIELSGGVTAMASGEIDRADGLTDLVVATIAADGAKLLVFEGHYGALRHEPELIDLPSGASSLGFGQLDDGYEMDLAVAAGSEVLIVHGLARKQRLDQRGPAVPVRTISRRRFDVDIISLATGHFTGGGRMNLAVLTLDGRVLTVEKGMAQDADTEIFRIKQGSGDHQTVRARITAARVSSNPVDSLLVMNIASHQLYITAADGSDGDSRKDMARSASFTALNVEAEPAAVMQMRLNGDALSDLVILKRAKEAVTIALTQPQAVFSVVTANDSGPGSLRQAIIDANNNEGLDAITFNIPGSGVPTIKLGGTLPRVDDATVIDGTSQPSGFVELDASNVRSSFGLAFSGGNSSVRGLVINRAGDAGIALLDNGNNIVEGNYLGTDVTGTTATGNLREGIIIARSASNTIGGTTPLARNILSGNLGGISIVEGSRDNRVQGNFIGTDVTGLASLSNTREGVYMEDSQNNSIGGTTSGAGNLISSNRLNGIFVFSASGAGSTGNLVQGNNIGAIAASATASSLRSATINPAASSDVSIVLTDSPRPVASGTRLNYSIKVSNNGPDPATDLTVITSTPAGTTFASIQAPGPSTSPAIGTNGPVTVTLSSLAPGQSVSATVVVNVIAAAGSTVSNTASVMSSSMDANTANNVATTATPILGGGVIALVWEQPASSPGDPTPAPRGLQVKPGTGIIAGLGNARSGVLIGDGGSNNTVGGTAVRAGNIIAGNGADGVVVGSGIGNAVLSNSIFSNLYGVSSPQLAAKLYCMSE